MTKTYFFDIDGVLIEHSGSLESQPDHLKILDNTKLMLSAIEKNGDKIILTTGRRMSMKRRTEIQLENLGIFYDELIMGCSRGARILVNDLKPFSNMKTSYSFSPKRNDVTIDEVEKIVTPCEERPWGNFSTLSYSSEYHIKEIKVNPNSASSLQSHNHRDELWIVISGSGVFVLDENEIQISKGSVCNVKKGQKHRVKNTGVEDLVFLEIQTGDKFSENDIVRYEDNYGRVI